MTTTSYKAVSKNQVLIWITQGLVLVKEDRGKVKIIKAIFGGPKDQYIRFKELNQRVNTRNRCTGGDPRVDIYYKGLRASVNVSHLVWMANTSEVIPPGWEIHHLDENPENNLFSNLILVHPLDHLKLHSNQEETPF